MVLLRLRAAALPLACLLAACDGSAPAPADPPAPGATATFHLLTLSDLQAYAEGVPCNPQDVAPLAAAATLRRELAAQGGGVVLACAGNTLFESGVGISEPPALDAVLARRTVVLDAMQAAGVDVFVPGPADLLGGARRLLDDAAARGLKVLATNLTVEGREIATHHVVELGGLRIALLGALPPGEGEENSSPEKGVLIEGPYRAVRRTARRLLEEGVSAVVLLSALPMKINQNLCKIDELHFIVGSSEAGPADKAAQRHGTTLLTQRHLGRDLAHTTLRIVDGNWALRDFTERSVIARQLERERTAWQEYVTRTGSDDPAVVARALFPLHEQEFLDKHSLMLENEQWVEEAMRYEGSYLEHRPVELGAVAPDADVLSVLARQAPAIRAAVEAHGPPPELDAKASMPGPGECLSCHAEQVAFWRATDHSRAWETLREQGRERDPSCLGCHASGYGHRGGYLDPRHDAPFGGVGCVNCHGVNRPHVGHRRLVVDPLYVRADADLLDCNSCHSNRRSPAFDRATAMARVRCPPMRPDDPVLVDVRSDVVDVIRRMRSRGESEPRDDYLEGRALIGLGRIDEGLQLVRKYAAENALQPAWVIEMADLAERHGRSQDALSMLSDFLRVAPGDLPVNKRYCELLLRAADPAVRDPGRALSHLQRVLPDDTPIDGRSKGMYLVKVEALLGAGRAAEGQQLLNRMANTILDDDDVRAALVAHGMLVPDTQAQR